MKKEGSKYERATKRVKELKGFYNHIKIFVVVNLALYLIKSGWFNRWISDGFPTESYYFDWIQGNFVIWILILGIHAVLIFWHKLPFFKNWEKRQLQKFMDKDQEKYNKHK